MHVLDTSKLVEIYVGCDDFIKKLDGWESSHLLGERPWRSSMSRPEVMAVLIWFHLSGFRCVKWYYERVILDLMKGWFPDAVSYGRFVELSSSVALELYAFFHSERLSEPADANYIDAKPIKSCHIKREKGHKVFRGIARKGKSSMGWFFGFKLHALVNMSGGLVAATVTPGNVADNNHDLLKRLFKGVTGDFFGDRGYWTKIRDELAQAGANLFAKDKKNAKPQKRDAPQLHYHKKRGLIETCFDLMSNKLSLEHTRHRSPKNFFVNLWACLTAYTFLDKLPSIDKYSPKNFIDTKNIVLI